MIPYLNNNFFLPLPYFWIYKINVMHLQFKMVPSSEEVKQKDVFSTLPQKAKRHYKYKNIMYLTICSRITFGPEININFRHLTIFYFSRLLSWLAFSDKYQHWTTTKQIIYCFSFSRCQKRLHSINHREFLTLSPNLTTVKNFQTSKNFAEKKTGSHVSRVQSIIW